MTHPRFTPSRRGPRGQAMIEFLVALIGLVPLFFAIAMLGKYLDIKSAIIDGGRYAAWERTVWYGDSDNGRTNSKTDAELQNEVRERIFSAPGTVMLQDDKSGRAKARAGANLMWNDYTNKPMLPAYTGTTAATAHRSQGGLLAGGVDMVLSAMNTFGQIGEMGSGGGFQLNQEGLYTAQLQVNVAQPPLLVRGLSGRAQAWTGATTTTPIVFGGGAGPTYGTSVLLADAWSASGPGWSNSSARVATQVSGMVPTSWPAGKLMLGAMALKPAGQQIAGDGAAMTPGKIDPDVVPPDRVP